MTNPGGRVWAARYRKVKAQLDRAKVALIEAGFPVEDEDDEGVARAVEILCATVREQRRQLEDLEFDHGIVPGAKTTKVTIHPGPAPEPEVRFVPVPVERERA